MAKIEINTPFMDKGKEYRLSHNEFGKTWVDLILSKVMQRVGLMINYRLWSVFPGKHVLSARDIFNLKHEAQGSVATEDQILDINPSMRDIK